MSITPSTNTGPLSAPADPRRPIGKSVAAASLISRPAVAAPFSVPPLSYQEAANADARRNVRSACNGLKVSVMARQDLIATAESVIGEFIGRRMVRFPASRLLARFADGSLPRSTRRALSHAVRTAVTDRRRQLAGRSEAPSAVRALSPSEVEFVNTRVDALIARIRERGNNSRAAVAHVMHLKSWRAEQIAG